jgi:hypothetical protein
MGNVVVGARRSSIIIPGTTAIEVSIVACRCVIVTQLIAGISPVGISVSGTTGMLVNGNVVSKVRAAANLDAIGILVNSTVVNAVVTGNMIKQMTVSGTGVAYPIRDLGTGTVGLLPQTNDISLL